MRNKPESWLRSGRPERTRRINREWKTQSVRGFRQRKIAARTIVGAPHHIILSHSEDQMKRLFVGTSGWVYKDWAGSFYPDDLPKASELAFYASQFNTVEINATF